MEYYKVIKSKEDYVIGPTSKGIAVFSETEEFPHCFYPTWQSIINLI